MDYYTSTDAIDYTDAEQAYYDRQDEVDETDWQAAGEDAGTEIKQAIKSYATDPSRVRIKNVCDGLREDLEFLDADGDVVETVSIGEAYDPERYDQIDDNVRGAIKVGEAAVAKWDAWLRG